MYSTDIVTSFLKDNEKILLLKRSSKVKSMKCLWAGISGILEKNETPLSRAKIELVNAAKQMKVLSPQYKNHEWNIFPFLFKIENPYVKLNWENSEFKWIEPTQLINYKTVPDLDKILSNLL